MGNLLFFGGIKNVGKFFDDLGKPDKFNSFGRRADFDFVRAVLAENKTHDENVDKYFADVGFFRRLKLFSALSFSARRLCNNRRDGSDNFYFVEIRRGSRDARGLRPRADKHFARPVYFASDTSFI